MTIIPHNREHIEAVLMNHGIRRMCEQVDGILESVQTVVDPDFCSAEVVIVALRFHREGGGVVYGHLHIQAPDSLENGFNSSMEGL